MNPPVYYNEFDPKAAAWIRELIKAGALPEGVVDERSIEDITPNELKDFTQLHFFAGIGGWAYAMQIAGWPDDRPIITGSCPCQPFSASGKGAGFADERHLWPAFFHLITQLDAPTVVGEQVASKGADDWVDLVQADMEAVGYAFGALAYPAACVGAPHVRDRLYWMGNASGTRGQAGIPESQDRKGRDSSITQHPSAGLAGATGRLATSGAGRSKRAPESLAGFWKDADWLLGRNGKWRPVEPGTFPLADGLPNRVGFLRGYGNAIVPQQAAIFLEMILELD